MADTQVLPRLFKYEQLTLGDIDGDATPEEIMAAYSDAYPALIGATVEGPVLTEDALLYTFVTKIGTKGAKGAAKSKGVKVKAPDYPLMRSVCEILLDDERLDDVMELPPSEALGVI